MVFNYMLLKSSRLLTDHFYKLYPGHILVENPRSEIIFDGELYGESVHDELIIL